MSNAMPWWIQLSKQQITPFELTDDHDAEKYWMLVEGFTLLLAVKWETEWCNQFCLPSNHTPGGKYSFV